METIIISVRSKTEARKLMRFSTENGWQTQSVNQLLDWLVKTAPKDVPLSDDDIKDEIRQVRESMTYAV